MCVELDWTLEALATKLVGYVLGFIGKLSRNVQKKKYFSAEERQCKSHCKRSEFGKVQL